MDDKSLRTASNAEAVLSFLRDRGILTGDDVSPQQIVENKQKRIVVAWIILNSLGFVVAYLQPLVAGGQYIG